MENSQILDKQDYQVLASIKKYRYQYLVQIAKKDRSDAVRREAQIWAENQVVADLEAVKI